MTRLLLLLAWVFTFALPRTVWAQTDITLSALPAAGKLAMGDAPQEVLVRVTNGSNARLPGTLLLESPDNPRKPLSTATVALEPHVTTVTRMVVPRGTEYVASFISTKGTVLATDTYSEAQSNLTLFQVSATTHLYALSSWPIRLSGRASQNATLALPIQDKASGDLLLPELGGSYAAVAATLIGSDQLVRMNERAYAVLTDYVRAGGTLAVVVRRPEDQKHERIVALAGGPLNEDPSSIPAVLSHLPKSKQGSTTGSGHIAAPDATEEEDDDETVDAGPETDAATDATASQEATNTTGLLSPTDLHVYRGGHLRLTEDGSEASFGVGRVVFLPYDADAHADSAWVMAKMADMISTSYMRRMRGLGTIAGLADQQLRKHIDPNQNFRWALALSTVILLLYGALFFPLFFGWAQRNKRLFAAFKWTPVASLGTFLLIVATGVIARGVGGSAQQLAFHQLEGGRSIGHQLLLRGFYSSQTDSRAIEPSVAGATIRVLEDNTVTESIRVLMSKGNYALVGIRQQPWSTVMVREDGPTPDLGAVDIVKTQDGTALIRNRMQSQLRDVLFFEPDTHSLHYFEKLDKGAEVKARDGIAAGTLGHGTTFTKSFGMRVRNLDLATTSLAPDARARIKHDWDTFEYAYELDFFPEGVPVLIASMPDVQAPATDMGVRVRGRASLIRVLGYGGAP